MSPNIEEIKAPIKAEMSPMIEETLMIRDTFSMVGDTPSMIDDISLIIIDDLILVKTQRCQSLTYMMVIVYTNHKDELHHNKSLQ